MCLERLMPPRWSARAPRSREQRFRTLISNFELAQAGAPAFVFTQNRACRTVSDDLEAAARDGRASHLALDTVASHDGTDARGRAREDQVARAELDLLR